MERAWKKQNRSERRDRVDAASASQRFRQILLERRAVTWNTFCNFLSDKTTAPARPSTRPALLRHLQRRDYFNAGTLGTTRVQLWQRAVTGVVPYSAADGRTSAEPNANELDRDASSYGGRRARAEGENLGKTLAKRKSKRGLSACTRHSLLQCVFIYYTVRVVVHGRGELSVSE